MLGNEVVGYQVTVNRLEHRAGTREITQFSLYGGLTEMREVSVNGLVGK